MAKVVLDARGGGLVKELAERCRRTGVPLVLAFCAGNGVPQKIAFAVCCALRQTTADGFKLILRRISNDSREAAEQIKQMADSGDVVVTADVLVAAKGIEGGAAAFNFNGWQYEDERAHQGAEERERMRAEGKLDDFRAMYRKEPRTPETIRLLFEGIGSVIPQFAKTASVASEPGVRIIVDADNGAYASAIGVGRAHNVPVVLVHGTGKPYLVSRLMTNQTCLFENGSFWICDIAVRPGKDAADHRIAAMAQPGDIVLTSDVALKRRCLLAGAVVVDYYGARFYPQDVGGKKLDKLAFSTLNRARFHEAAAKYQGCECNYVVADALEAVLADAAGQQPRGRLLPYQPNCDMPSPLELDHNMSLRVVPSMARTLSEA